MRIYSNEEKKSYGYTYENMVMIDKELAKLLYENGEENIFILHDMDTESLVETKEDFNLSSDMYGVDLGK